MFFFSSSWLQRKTAIFDCGTSWSFFSIEANASNCNTTLNTTVFELNTFRGIYHFFRNSFTYESYFNLPFRISNFSDDAFKCLTITGPRHEKICLRGLRPVKTQTGQLNCSLEILCIGIILSRRRTTKVRIRLRESASLYAPLLFAYMT